jgi:two-component system sensor histidine kinase KdpD
MPDDSSDIRTPTPSDARWKDHPGDAGPDTGPNRDAEAIDVWSNLPQPLALPAAVVCGALLTLAATLCGHALSGVLPAQGISLIFLLAVLLGAVGFGVLTGMASAIFAFLAYNFFFIPPTFTFTVAEPREVFALIVFFIIAILTGSLAGRMREVAARAQARAASLQTLNAFTGELSGTLTRDKIIAVLARGAAHTFGGDSIVLMKSDDRLVPSASVPGGQAMQSADWQAAQRCVRTGHVIYPSAPGWPGGRYEFHPIASLAGVCGVLGLARSPGASQPSRETERTVHLMLQHASIALDRTRLQEESTSVRDQAERERLRSALISSVSHDLRTPLASILGAVTSLREFGPKMSEETRADLLVAIEEETGHLSQFVVNLLDMTRLQADMPDLRRDWLDVTDVVNVALTRAKLLFPDARLTFTVTPALPLIRGDAILFEHVVFNLLDNAVKFSTTGLSIDIKAAQEDQTIVLSVTDNGRGIASEELAHVFDKFYRGRQRDRDVIAGTGLGLTLCKRIVEGMGGTIRAESPVAAGRGTCIIIHMPIPDAAPVTGTPTAEAAAP